VVGKETEHRPHVIKEFHAFVAKEYSKHDANDIEPLRMVCVTPVLHALYEIHTTIVFR